MDNQQGKDEVGGLVGTGAFYKSRMRLFEELIKVFPGKDKEPTGNLVDLVPLE